MTTPTNTLRGTVIRVPGDQPGLIVADGRQWPFDIAGVWHSPIAPALNQTVDVMLDENGAIAGITVVAGSQQAAEKLKQAAGVAAAWAQGPGAAKLNHAKEWVASQPGVTKKLGLWLGIGAACLASLVFAIVLLSWVFSGGEPSENQIRRALVERVGQNFAFGSIPGGQSKRD